MIREADLFVMALTEVPGWDRPGPVREALARPLLEIGEPAADRWRELGYFRPRMPLPAGHVSQRDQFLLLTGRDPHPFLDD